MNTTSSAVVIGGSIAGMLAAHAIAPHFASVILVERDSYPDDDAVRSGTPQAHHLHLLLGRGLQILEAMLPGISADLEALGAVRVDVGRETSTYFPNGWLPKVDSGVYSYGISRSALERAIRARVLSKHANIRILQSREVSSLTEHEGVITGVVLRKRRTDEHEVLPAALVVDASGRSSKAPEWFTALGYETPEETLVEAPLGYATRWYKRPANAPALKGLLMRADRNARTPRGGGYVQVEGDRWAVVLSGLANDAPPTDEAGFLDYAASMASPLLREALHDAEPLTPVYSYRYQGSRWRHYERMARRPARFILLGDAVCSFNPIYGQGMTVAAMGAELLARMMRRSNPLKTGFAGRYQRQLARILRFPWQLATSEDLRIRSDGAKPSPFRQYFAELIALMPRDEAITRAFVRVANLVEPPSAFLHPRIVWRVLRQRWFRTDGDLAVQSRWQAPDARPGLEAR